MRLLLISNSGRPCPGSETRDTRTAEYHVVRDNPIVGIEARTGVAPGRPRVNARLPPCVQPATSSRDGAGAYPLREAET